MKDDIVFQVMMLLLVLFTGMLIGVTLGENNNEHDLRKQLISIGCGEYNRTTGEFEIVNLYGDFYER